MELKEGNRVITADGSEAGKINRFVINPVTLKVTHLVVQKGFLFPEDKVIPINWVASTSEDQVTLSKRAGEVQDLPPFEELHYVPLDEAEQQRLTAVPYGYGPAYYWYPPFGAPGIAYPYYAEPVADVAVETERNIPKNTVPLEEGAAVIGADGEHVGDVERVMVDPGSNRATHFLISKGLLLKERKLVPIDWVERVMEREVHLGVGSRFIDRLPDYQE